MSLDKTRGQNYSLSKLLEGIDRGSVALPDFQRDFDWTTNDVRSLLATVVSGWPIGSLLLTGNPMQKIFNLRPIDQAPPLIADIETIVLDGQQRLTALYHALYGHGAMRYGLRIDLVDDEQTIDSVDEAIVAFPADEWGKKYKTPGDQLASSLVPLTALRDAASFFEWRDAAQQVTHTDRDLTDLYRRLLSGLHNYDVPAVVIHPDVPPAGIARIFERVNRMGMPLGTFDLVVAKSFSPSFNLRDEWARARQDYPRLDAFLGDDGLGVLNVIALRTTENVRQRAVLDMPGSAVRDGWQSGTRAMDDAIRFLSSRLGVWNPDWLPYKNILTILAALSYDRNLDEIEDRVILWFWKTAFERRYDVASNTRAVADYQALLDLGEPPWQEGPIRLVREDMLECNRRQFGTLHRAFTCFLASLEPGDVLTRESLNASSLEQGVLPEAQMVALFPSSYYFDTAVPGHLLTLAMVLASKASSRKVASTAFDLLEDDPATCQLIPDPTPDDVAVSAFVSARFSLFTNAIEETTGTRVRVRNRDL